MLDGVRSQPLAKPLLPFFNNLGEYFEDIKGVFDSEYWIQKTHTPIIILHGVHDEIINIDLARKLYFSAKDNPKTNVRILETDEYLGHDYLHQSKHFKQDVREFVENTS